MSPAIRAATPADLVAVTAIYDHAVRQGTASFELAPPDASEMARRRQALVDAGYPYLVAEIDGVIAGYAYAGPYRARPAYRWSVEDSIYVAPHMHRRGVGAALLGRLIADAEQSGFRQMIVSSGIRPRRRRSRCIGPLDSGPSAGSRMSASSSAAGSTRF